MKNNIYSSAATKYVSFVLIVVAFIAATGAKALAQYDYIDITNPFLRKIPIAIPEFKAVRALEGELRASGKGSDLLSDALVFTGYFTMIDRVAYLSDPQQAALEGPGIQFRNWTAIGAELLVTGGVILGDGKLEMELRLFDTIQQNMLVGKKYVGAEEDLRKMIHRFASEVVFHLTGNRGIFDSKIAFVSTGSGNKEIYVCDFDGNGVSQFTSHKSITLFPAWSYDSQWIAYTSYAKGKPDLYIKNVGRKAGAVVARKGLNSFPAWMPGKLELGATLSFSGDQEIYLLSSKGSLIKQLTVNEGIDVSPTFSPDGKQMAFVSRRAGSPQIYIQNLETGSVRRLTFEGNYNTQPDWSPQGDKIAYSSMGGGELNICVMGVDGSGPLQLTYNTRNNESPSWSPDGSMIAFSSTREGPSRIYAMTAFGTDQRRLLTAPGEQSNPDWSPGVVDTLN